MQEKDAEITLRLFAEAKDLTAVDFRIFISSRLEILIFHGLRNMPEIIYEDLALQKIPRLIFEKDITMLLKHELLK